MTTATSNSADTTAGHAGNSGLRIRDLRKEYPTPSEPLIILQGVSLDLAGGQSLAVVGPSGSGKSTLLNIIGTLDTPTSGTVLIDGANPFALSVAQLARFRSEKIGFIFQDHHLLPQLNATENVLIAKLAAGGVKKTDIQRAGELLRRVGLEGRSTHLPGELSGGERQRVAIARALINGPSLLLCDEPTGNLDSKTSQTVADLLFDLAGQSSAILIAVTHSRDFAERFGMKMRMSDGALVAE